MSIEKDRLDIRSQPLRQYMSDNIMPILTEALIKISSELPVDPLEYLATYLEENEDIFYN